MILGIKWGSLRAKIVAWSFVPTAVILLAIAAVGIEGLAKVGSSDPVVSIRTAEQPAVTSEVGALDDARKAGSGAPGAAAIDEVVAYRRALVILLALGLLVPPLVAAVGAQRIARPVTDMIAAADDVARGDFRSEITARTGDEIEELAEHFNTMTRELEASCAEMEQRVANRTRELQTLSEAEHRRAEQFRIIAEVGRHMAAILPMDELLDRIVQLIHDAFGYYHVGIALVEGEFATYRSGAGELWNRACGDSGEPAFGFRPPRLKVGEEGVTGWVAGTGEPLMVPDVSREVRYVHMEGSGACSELAVPIKAGDEVIGVIDVQSNVTDAFDESDLIVMQALANQAAIAIQNARLYERAGQLAAVEERQRVARDLHDSVTQSLYAVTLYADAASRLLDSGQVGQATDHCSQLRDTAKEALREMRLLIFELRPPELAKVGLVAALGARLEAVEGRAGLKTELVADERFTADAPAEEELFRIAQEALNNTLKHAEASSVRVTVHRDDRAISLEVADDGKGFDSSSARQGGGMGLRGMQERAARLGGRLTLESKAGEGATIRVEIPV